MELLLKNVVSVHLKIKKFLKNGPRGCGLKKKPYIY